MNTKSTLLSTLFTLLLIFAFTMKNILDYIEQIDKYLWKIPEDYTDFMRVPAYFFADVSMLEKISSDGSLEQLVNVASLPGIQKYSLAMPDMHRGYGFPIGGVAAMDVQEGVISPGGIGYDINCGVRLLKTTLLYQDVKNKLEELSKELFKEIPSGLGKRKVIKLNNNNLDKVLKNGAEEIVKMGFGREEDLHFTESLGKLETADPKAVSSKAKDRGRTQIGTIGSGNHFVEVDRVATIFDKKTAQIYGLHPDQIVILIHTGSRGLGHQTATDYIREMLFKLDDFGIKLPDKQLACVPFNSSEGQRYFSAMSAAANFAWANRQMVTHLVRKVFKKLFNEDKISVLYDVAHNIAKIESYTIDGKKKKVVVHRKGATRAFPAKHPEVIPEYRPVGQPVLIPGSMGTASYVLKGAEKSIELSFGSTCHGAGRELSRRKAKKQVNAKELIQELKKQGIFAQGATSKGIAEEAPIAYKDIHSVIDVVHNAGIALKVAELKPLAVIKG